LKSKPTLQLLSVVNCEAITHWLKALPVASVGTRSGLLLNDAGVKGLPLVAVQDQSEQLVRAGFTSVKTVSACACCMGALALRTELVRLLREPLERIVVISTHWAHLSALDASLSGAPFDLYVQRVPSQLLLTQACGAAAKKPTLQALFEKWDVEWVFTN
jgi:hypothetical protein